MKQMNIRISMLNNTANKIFGNNYFQMAEDVWVGLFDTKTYKIRILRVWFIMWFTKLPTVFFGNLKFINMNRYNE
jgi:hypothetical protein